MMFTEVTVAPSVTAFCSTASPLESEPGTARPGSVYWICSGMPFVPAHCSVSAMASFRRVMLVRC